MLAKFGHCFSAAAQEQGAALCQQGLVRAIYGSERELRVEILDCSGAEATWRISRNRLQPSCTCQSFHSGGLCAHLWGALLLAEQQGDLALARRKCVSSKIDLVPIAPAVTDLELSYQPLEPVSSRRLRAAAVRSSEGEEEPRFVPLRRKERRPIPIGPELDLSLAGPEILYVLSEERFSPEDDFLCLESWWRQSGVGGRASCRPFYPEGESLVSESRDARTLTLLLQHNLLPAEKSGNLFTVKNPALREFFLLQAGSSSLRWRQRGIRQGEQWQKLQIPGEYAAEFAYSFHRNPQGQYETQITLQTAEGSFQLAEIVCLGLCGVAIAGGNLFQTTFAGAEKIVLERWQAARDARPTPPLSQAQAVSLTRTICLASDPDSDSWPQELRCQFCRPQVRAVLFVKTGEVKFAGKEQLHADLSFDYQGRRCSEDEPQIRLPGITPSQILERDLPAEAELGDRLLALGFQPENRRIGGYRLPPAKLEEAVLILVQEDWLVTAAGKTYRKPGEKKAFVRSSGLDWFEINGEIDFAGQKMALPKLLQALRRGASSVRLDDGTYGILPREWLENFTPLLEIGQTSDQRILLRRRQAALVQALLAERLQDSDGKFTDLATAWQRLPTPSAQLPPAGFQGVLRAYQQEGLGWLLAMRDLGLGGCLADDMGLGKTVQVLALLSWQKLSGTGKASLVVAPKSLLFNWQLEAERFAPTLRCGCYIGNNREHLLERLSQLDVLLTTYGTLRADLERLAKCQFDYCILDESQAIKNADSATAQAARIIRAEHRLAMTGTPIENRLSELFSQLEFLNPGLLGEKFLARWNRLAAELTEEQSRRLRQAVHPFLLRRNKCEVAADLPQKTEEVLFCELAEPQLQQYTELKEYYRRELLLPAAGGSQIKALAALLRLRQAACHPGLLDERRAGQTSAKLEVLLEYLQALAEAGQKALIFSQFSRFLRLLEPHLQVRGLKYCYLDGQTQNRGELVRQFQENPQILFFLISLKAGGTGLNLTAAEYVFLLDPWWNPAVESQAIDRAYRIGQTKPVFAYRLIARNTVEEKVLQMQLSKRQLADSILAEAPKSARELQPADWQFLFQ